MPACVSQETTSLQLPLFAELGVESLPVGMSGLTTKETRFVLAFLRTGLAATAAREAGYSDPEADASKIRKRPAIAAILTQAATQAAGNASALARRAWERSQALHDELQRIRPEVQRIRAMPLPNDDEARSLHMAGLRFVEDRERWLFDQATKQDSLLVAMHQKLEVKVSGSVEHTHVVLTAKLTQELQEARRAALTRGN